MVNGKPGDHPLADLSVHGLEVYGQEPDALIRRIAQLSSDRELNEWWEKEIGWNATPDKVLEKAKARLNELEKRAKEHG